MDHEQYIEKLEAAIWEAVESLQHGYGASLEELRSMSPIDALEQVIRDNNEYFDYA